MEALERWGRGGEIYLPQLWRAASAAALHWKPPAPAARRLLGTAIPLDESRECA